MKLYIDIDGVLLNYDTDTRADHSVELIDYITKEFDCYWLTTHCKGDAGPILFNLSPTGTAFGIGSITYFEDFELRKKFLKTAELAGFTVTKGDKKHYLLADVALVGEAITLAMRTATNWN
jgi:hypothetical protein